MKSLVYIEDFSDVELRKAYVMLGDPRAIAYENICKYAEYLSDIDQLKEELVSADELIQTGIAYINRVASLDSIIYLKKGSIFYGQTTKDSFFDDLSVLIDEPITEDQRGNFFSSSVMWYV